MTQMRVNHSVLLQAFSGQDFHMHQVPCVLQSVFWNFLFPQFNILRLWNFSFLCVIALGNQDLFSIAEFPLSHQYLSQKTLRLFYVPPRFLWVKYLIFFAILSSRDRFCLRRLIFLSCRVQRFRYVGVHVPVQFKTEKIYGLAFSSIFFFLKGHSIHLTNFFPIYITFIIGNCLSCGLIFIQGVQMFHIIFRMLQKSHFMKKKVYMKTLQTVRL